LGSFVGDVLPLFAVELPGCLFLLPGCLFLAATEVGVDPVKDSASGNVLLFVVFSLLLLSLADLLNYVPLAFLGPEVVVQVKVVRLQVFQKLLLRKHLVELLQTVAVKLSRQ
jgi:hypothetical protein